MEQGQNGKNTPTQILNGIDENEGRAKNRQLQKNEWAAEEDENFVFANSVT